MGEFIYLNSTIYNLSFQRELSFAFTGVSILIGIIMLFFNKPKLILPKATYYFIGAFLLFFILSAVINRANLYLAIWSFINIFKYLIYLNIPNLTNPYFINYNSTFRLLIFISVNIFYTLTHAFTYSNFLFTPIFFFCIFSISDLSFVILKVLFTDNASAVQNIIL